MIAASTSTSLLVFPSLSLPLFFTLSISHSVYVYGSDYLSVCLSVSQSVSQQFFVNFFSLTPFHYFSLFQLHNILPQLPLTANVSHSLSPIPFPLSSYLTITILILLLIFLSYYSTHPSIHLPFFSSLFLSVPFPSPLSLPLLFFTSYIPCFISPLLLRSSFSLILPLILFLYYFEGSWTDSRDIRSLLYCGDLWHQDSALEEFSHVGCISSHR